MRFILHVFANVNSIVSALCEALHLIEQFPVGVFSTVYVTRVSWFHRTTQAINCGFNR